MSSTSHSVVRGPSLTGFGNFPSFTPCHQVDFDTGIRGVSLRCGSPTICLIRKKPVVGSESVAVSVLLGGPSISPSEL